MQQCNKLGQKLVLNLKSKKLDERAGGAYKTVEQETEGKVAKKGDTLLQNEIRSFSC